MEGGFLLRWQYQLTIRCQMAWALSFNIARLLKFLYFTIWMLKNSCNNREITVVKPFNFFLLPGAHNVQQCNGNYADLSTHNSQRCQPMMLLVEICWKAWRKPLQCVKRSHFFRVPLRSHSFSKKRSATLTSLLLIKRSGTPHSLFQKRVHTFYRSF